MEELTEPTKPVIFIRILTLIALLAFLPLLIIGFESAAIISGGIVFMGAELGRKQSLT